jgi:NAD(P)H-dependent FMN reductase
MPQKPRILAFAGSLRKESYNKKFVRVAADAARRAGAEVTVMDLCDYPLPIFDEDLEKAKGLPEHAKRIKELFNTHQALLISTPEYNSSLPAVLKNTIDWVTRKADPSEPSLRDFNGKVALLFGASPGALGGLRCLVHLRAILSNINVLVLPQQHALAKADQAFNDDGSLKDANVQKTVDTMTARLVEVTQRLGVEQS